MKISNLNNFNAIAVILVSAFLVLFSKESFASSEASKEELAVERYRLALQSEFASALENFDLSIFEKSKTLCLEGVLRYKYDVEVNTRVKYKIQNIETKQFLESGRMRDSGCLGFIMLSRGSIVYSMKQLSSRERAYWEGSIGLVENAITDLKKISSKFITVTTEKEKLIENLESSKAEYANNLEAITPKKSKGSYRISLDKGYTVDGRCTFDDKFFSGSIAKDGYWNICGGAGCTSSKNRNEAITRICN